MQRMESMSLVAVAVAVLVVLAVAAGGCGGGAASPPEPVLAQLLVDPSVVGLERAVDTAEEVAERLASRPGSGIEVFVMGETDALTRLAFETVVPAVTARSPRGRADATRRFIQDTRVGVENALASTFAAERTCARPVAGSISRLARMRGAGETVLVVLSNLREVSPSDGTSPAVSFDQGTIPTPAEWRAWLDARGYLQPGSLSGVEVVVGFVDLEPTACPPCSSLARQQRVERLVTASLLAAGATDASTYSSKPQIDRALSWSGHQEVRR